MLNKNIKSLDNETTKNNSFRIRGLSHIETERKINPRIIDFLYAFYNFRKFFNPFISVLAEFKNDKINVSSPSVVLTKYTEEKYLNLQRLVNNLNKSFTAGYLKIEIVHNQQENTIVMTAHAGLSDKDKTSIEPWCSYYGELSSETSTFNKLCKSSQKIDLQEAKIVFQTFLKKVLIGEECSSSILNFMVEGLTAYTFYAFTEKNEHSSILVEKIKDWRRQVNNDEIFDVQDFKQNIIKKILTERYIMPDTKNDNFKINIFAASFAAIFIKEFGKAVLLSLLSDFLKKLQKDEKGTVDNIINEINLFRSLFYKKTNENFDSFVLNLLGIVI